MTTEFTVEGSVETFDIGAFRTALLATFDDAEDASVTVAPASVIVTATLIYASAGRSLVAPPLLALVLHLCVGDTWNCITNVERRLGTAAVGVFGVLASVYFAVAVYFKALPLAGYLLAPSAVWISIATVLTWAIWNINEPREPLLPQKGDGLGAPLRLPLSSVFEA